MAEHREQVDKRMMQQINRRIITPLLLDLGARYLVQPYMGKLRRRGEDRQVGLWPQEARRQAPPHDRGVPRGISYTDGEKTEGKTYQRVEDRYSAWSVKHDNRLVQNDETVRKSKVASFEETYNEIKTFTSLDLMQRFSCISAGRDCGHRRLRHVHHRGAGAQRGQDQQVRPQEARGCAGHVRPPFSTPVPSTATTTMRREGCRGGRSCKRARYGLWTAPSRLSTRSRPSSRRGRGTRASSSTWRTGQATTGCCRTGSIGTSWSSPTSTSLLSFMRKEQVLQYKWLPKLNLSDESKRGRDWLADEANRRVGPVYWNRVRVNENVAALEPE